MTAERPRRNPRNSRLRRVKWIGSSVRDEGDDSANASTMPVPRPEAHDTTAQAHGTLLTDERTSAVVASIDYAPGHFEYQEVSNIADFLDSHRPEWSTVRWINVSGLDDPDIILSFAEKYELHPLAVDDVVRRNQRPKAEDFPASEEHPGRLFVLARMIHVEKGYLFDEQISFFLGRHTLLTFQEAGGDVFEPIRQRIKHGDPRLRHGDVSLLLHALLDAIIDELFPLLEECSEQLECLERIVLGSPQRNILRRIHRVRRELLLLRRGAWPMRELINQLQRAPRTCLSESSQIYFRDVYNNLTQIIDLLETYRDFAMGIAETYMSSMANRMNEIMKTLTIITTIFVPLTFLAGVYGMNMPIPENSWEWTYALFWAFCVSLAGGMLLWFRRRGWF